MNTVCVCVCIPSSTKLHFSDLRVHNQLFCNETDSSFLLIIIRFQRQERINNTSLLQQCFKLLCARVAEDQLLSISTGLSLVHLYSIPSCISTYLRRYTARN